MRIMSDGRPQWTEILIVVLKFLLTLLSGAGAATALVVSNSPSMRATSLDPTSQWFWILLAVVLALAIATWAFARWRSTRQDQEGELFDQVLDFVEWVLKALEEEAGRRLREIPQAEVERAAIGVYESFIADTALAVVPQAVFVDFVVARWRQLAGVQAEVKRLMAGKQGQPGYTTVGPGQ